MVHDTKVGQILAKKCLRKITLEKKVLISSDCTKNSSVLSTNTDKITLGELNFTLNIEKIRFLKRIGIL